jgi:hypothetical protein
VTRKGVVVGFPYPSRYLAGLMNEHSRRWRLRAFPSTRPGLMHALWDLRNADALISFGGPGPNAALSLAAHRRRVPLIVIWAGTDVLAAETSPFDLEVTKRDTSADVAVSPWLADELRSIGVPAVYQPVISADVAPVVAPFPKRFTVLTYLPAPRRTFYGEDRVYAIAREMKNARFLVVGSGARNPNAPPNVEFLGQVEDVNPVVDVSSVLLRLPQHDGQSMMVLEAMSRGRHVVWTYQIPGVRTVKTTEDALEALVHLQSLHRDGNLEFNTAGRDYVAQNCARAEVAASFESCLDRTMPRRAIATNGHRKRVAISGFGLFCAEVAKNIERLHPDWEAQILRPTSRIEVLTALLHLCSTDIWYSIGSPIESRWMHYAAQLLHIPRVMHWVGSDIESARSDEKLRQAILSAKAMHLTEIDWTARELADLGLASRIVPLPTRHQGGGVKPLPERFTIMLYLPKSRSEFYGRHAYERLLHDVAPAAPRVFVVGGGTLSAPHSVEIVNCGWRSDLREIYEQSTLLIRCTPHDGLALMVVEALSFGRHVIWSKPFPYVTEISTYEQVLSAVRDLLSRHDRGALHAQYNAAEMVRERYATDRCVREILAVFDDARERRISAA